MSDSTSLAGLARFKMHSLCSSEKHGSITTNILLGNGAISQKERIPEVKALFCLWIYMSYKVLGEAGHLEGWNKKFQKALGSIDEVYIRQLMVAYSEIILERTMTFCARGFQKD
jgi:hypothetical protein